MKYIITESQHQKLKNYENDLTEVMQDYVDFTLDKIRDESEEWGMGEMDELHEIGAIDKIKIDRIEKDKVLNVYVNIYLSYPRYDFENTLNEIEYRLRKQFPKINFIENEIIDERTFGPGIDW